MKLALLVLVLLLAVVAAQIGYYAPRLPAKVASHFTASGAPDGWAPRSEFLEFYVIILLVTIVPFVLLPPILRHIPDSLINLPRKDYWLAPEQREETFRTLGSRMLWFGNATLMLVSHVMGVTLAANLTPHPRLGDAALWALVAYLAFTVVWLVSLLRYFYRKPPTNPTRLAGPPGEDRFGAA
jgi:uncharacterized membrane protein